MSLKKLKRVDCVLQKLSDDVVEWMVHLLLWFQFHRLKEKGILFNIISCIFKKFWASTFHSSVLSFLSPWKTYKEMINLPILWRSHGIHIKFSTTPSKVWETEPLNFHAFALMADVFWICSVANHMPRLYTTGPDGNFSVLRTISEFAFTVNFRISWLRLNLLRTIWHFASFVPARTWWPTSATEVHFAPAPFLDDALGTESPAAASAESDRIIQFFFDRADALWSWNFRKRSFKCIPSQRWIAHLASFLARCCWHIHSSCKGNFSVWWTCWCLHMPGPFDWWYHAVTKKKACLVSISPIWCCHGRYSWVSRWTIGRRVLCRKGAKCHWLWIVGVADMQMHLHFLCQNLSVNYSWKENGFRFASGVNGQSLVICCQTFQHEMRMEVAGFSHMSTLSLRGLQCWLKELDLGPQSFLQTVMTKMKHLRWEWNFLMPFSFSKVAAWGWSGGVPSNNFQVLHWYTAFFLVPCLGPTKK